MEDENQRGECGWAALERDREEEEEEEAMASCSTELTRSDSGSLSLTANHVFEDLSRVGANAFLVRVDLEPTCGPPVANLWSLACGRPLEANLWRLSGGLTWRPRSGLRSVAEVTKLIQAGRKPAT